MNDEEEKDEIKIADKLCEVAFNINIDPSGGSAQELEDLKEIEAKLNLIEGELEKIFAAIEQNGDNIVLAPAISAIDDTYRDLATKFESDGIVEWKKKAGNIPDFLQDINRLMLSKYPGIVSPIKACVDEVTANTDYTDPYGQVILMNKYMHHLQLKGYIIIANLAYLKNQSPTSASNALQPYVGLLAAQDKSNIGFLDNLTQWVSLRTISSGPYGIFGADDGGDSNLQTNSVTCATNPAPLEGLQFYQNGTAFGVKANFDCTKPMDWVSPVQPYTASQIVNDGTSFFTGDVMCDPGNVVVGVQLYMDELNIGIGLQQAPYDKATKTVGTPGNWINTTSTAVGPPLFANGPVHCNTYLSEAPVITMKEFSLVVGVRLGLLGNRIVPQLLPMKREFILATR